MPQVERSHRVDRHFGVVAGSNAPREPHPARKPESRDLPSSLIRISPFASVVSSFCLPFALRHLWPRMAYQRSVHEY